LLDSQSAIDLICNKALVTDVFESNKSMRLKSNDGTMIVRRQSKVKGSEKKMW
jgi:hypothetical protein